MAKTHAEALGEDKINKSASYWYKPYKKNIPETSPRRQLRVCGVLFNRVNLC